MKLKNTRIKFINIAVLTTSVILMHLTSCQKASTPNQVWTMVDNCSLHESTCTQHNGDQSIKLTVTPQPVTVAKPLNIKVQTKNLDIVSMQLDIDGINMYMGYNRTNLEVVGKQLTNHWQGSTMLAFCTNNRMTWKVTVAATLKNGKVIEAPFKLTTYNKHGS
jgi:hypothetical protein